MADGAAFSFYTQSAGLPASLDVSAQGDNTVIPGVAGKSIRISHYGLQALAANTANVTAILKGVQNSVSSRIYAGDFDPGQPYSHRVGIDEGYLQLDPGVPLVVNLSVAQGVHFNGEYELI